MNKISTKHTFTLSDVGRVRNNNEDVAKVLVGKDEKTLALLVLDGMGGHGYGEYAANLALDAFEEEFNQLNILIGTRIYITSWIGRVLRKLNTIVFNAGEKNLQYKGMGTTIVLALITSSYIYIANVGDSRAYEVKYNKLKLLSEDQSIYEYLNRTGQINDENKESINKNALTSALGAYPSVSYNLFVYKNNENPILLCSDGLTNSLSEEKIHEIIRQDKPYKEKIRELIEEAKHGESTDNISVAYWEK